MPKFKLNKLVREGLGEEYRRLGQKANYSELTLDELKIQLIKKIKEEAQEVPVIQGQISDVKEEIADILQAVYDLIDVCKLDKDSVEVVRQSRHAKMGGFAAGLFVETIELRENDEWTEYYRSYPERFPEIK